MSAKKEDEDRPISRWAREKEPEKPQRLSSPPPAPPKAKPPPPPSDYELAKSALTTFLATSGDLYIEELVAAAKKIKPEERDLFYRSIPVGYGRIAIKCQRAREEVKRAFKK